MTNDKQQVRLLQRQGEHKGKHYALKKNVITLGSDSSSNIVIHGSFVSPQHAKISRRDDGLWMITNLSVNRTLVNQQVVETQQLESGDMIQIGAETLFEFEIIDKKANKEEKKVAEKDTKPLTQRPLIQISVAIYLLLIVVLGIYLKGFNRETTEISLSAETVETILSESREYIVSEEFIRATEKIQIISSSWDTEAAATYFELVSSLKPGSSAENADANPLLDELLARSRDHLYSAWKYERQMRWQEAIHEYQTILKIVPDIRIPLVSFVMNRISLIKEQIE